MKRKDCRVVFLEKRLNVISTLYLNIFAMLYVYILIMLKLHLFIFLCTISKTLGDLKIFSEIVPNQGFIQKSIFNWN